MSENFEKHNDTIDQIYRQTREDLWTMPVATLVLLLGAVLFITIIVNTVFVSFPNLLVAVLVYLIEISAPLFVLYRYQQKVYKTVHERVAELEAVQPGILRVYEEWHGNAAPPRL